MPSETSTGRFPGEAGWPETQKPPPEQGFQATERRAQTRDLRRDRPHQPLCAVPREAARSRMDTRLRARARRDLRMAPRASDRDVWGMNGARGHAIHGSTDLAGVKLAVGGNEQAEFVSASGGGRMSPDHCLPPRIYRGDGFCRFAPSLSATRSERTLSDEIRETSRSMDRQSYAHSRMAAAASVAYPWPQCARIKAHPSSG